MCIIDMWQDPKSCLPQTLCSTLFSSLFKTWRMGFGDCATCKKNKAKHEKKNEISLEWPSLPFFDFKMLHTYSFETIEQ